MTWYNVKSLFATAIPLPRVHDKKEYATPHLQTSQLEKEGYSVTH